MALANINNASRNMVALQKGCCLIFQEFWVGTQHFLTKYNKSTTPKKKKWPVFSSLSSIFKKPEPNSKGSCFW